MLDINILLFSDVKVNKFFFNNTLFIHVLIPNYFKCNNCNNKKKKIACEHKKMKLTNFLLFK